MAEARAAAVKTGKNITHTIFVVISWIVGLFFILSALLINVQAIVLCITWILAGLIILPPVTKLIPQFKGKTLVLILVFVILLLVGLLAVGAQA